MPFTVEMTGAQDYQRMIKMAIAGFPGTGKTLFSSTAPTAFFVFFREQPRIMSIADRYMPHAKVTNKVDDSGRLVTPVWDTFHEVIDYLDSERGEAYGSTIIDTGDELFQALKEGRKLANRGKWGIQDWGWLGDMYREIINRVIDLPKHVIITYHLKSSQEGDDGEIIREIALQGQAKDEVAGWFDIVGVIDSWEEEGEDSKLLHRGMLTHTTPKYPFVKDHSGKLPKVFELSDNFVGDFQRMYDLIYKDIPASDHETIEIVKPEPKAKPDASKTSAETGVPTPEDIDKKKGKKKGKKKKEEDEPDKQDEAPKDDAPDEKEASSEEASGEPEEKAAKPKESEADKPKSEEADEADDSGEEESGSDDEVTSEATPEEALATVEEELGATVVEATCEFEEEDGEKCGEPLVKRKLDANGDSMANEDGEPVMIPDKDLMDLTKIRFRKYMCRDHFTAERKKK